MNALHRPRTQLRLEFLEDRITPTCTITQGDFDANGTMDFRLVGDNAFQNLTIDDDPNAGTTTITLDCNGDGDFLDPGEMDHQVLNQVFETFDLQLLGGNDQVLFNPPVTDYVGVSRSLLVDLGVGSDVFTFQAINGVDILQSSVSIELFGGAGNDDLQVEYANVDASAVSAVVEAGSGQDAGRVILTGTVSNGSVLDFNFDLGTQSNEFFAQVDSIDNATVSIHVVGSNRAADVDSFQWLDFNTAALTNNARLFIEFILQAGNDTASSSIHLSHWDTDAGSEAHFRIDGGEGDDQITLGKSSNGNANTDIAGLWDFNLNGGPGNDTITLDYGSNGSTLDIDGTFRVHANGDIGNDVLQLNLTTDADASGGLDVGLLGGAGNDTLTYTFTSDGTTGIANGPFMLLDGGSGLDGGTVNGSGGTFNPTSIRKRNCETQPTAFAIGNVTTGDFDGNGSQDIAVVGNNSALNTINVIDDAVAGTTTVQIDANGDGDFADLLDKNQTFPSLFETIIIRGLGGQDNITVQIPNGYASLSRSILIDAGPANDIVTVTQTNNVTGSNVNVELLGGTGNDQVNLTGMQGVTSALYLNGDLGVGSDNSFVSLNGGGAGFIEEIDFLLGKGTNSFTIDVQQGFTNAVVVVDIAGGKKPKEADTLGLRAAVGAAAWDSTALFYNANLLAGGDSFSLDLDLGNFDVIGSTNFRVRVDGGPGDDVFIVSRNFFSTGDSNTEFASRFDIGLFGGDGDDGLSLDLTGNGSTFDLDSTFRIRLLGGGGNDSIIFRAATHGDSSGNFDLVLLGNGGADSLTFSLDANGAETFSPAGFALVDGGSGVDVLVANGTGFLTAELKTRGAG